jgi:hypothetical protein
MFASYLSYLTTIPQLHNSHGVGQDDDCFVQLHAGDSP